MFAVLMDRLADEIRQETLWTMMFADNIAGGREAGEVKVCSGEQSNESQ